MEWVQPDAANGEIVLEQWIFLVTEDGRLVSAYGCQVEEAQAEAGTVQMIPGEHYSNVKRESRNYTGQTLEHFVEMEEEFRREESSSTVR